MRPEPGRTLSIDSKKRTWVSLHLPSYFLHPPIFLYKKPTLSGIMT